MKKKKKSHLLQTLWLALIDPSEQKWKMSLLFSHTHILKQKSLLIREWLFSLPNQQKWLRINYVFIELICQKCVLTSSKHIIQKLQFPFIYICHPPRAGLHESYELISQVKCRPTQLQNEPSERT